MKQITTDNYDFVKLRRMDALYVDKTRYVWELVSSATSIYFFSRPRRFGKSLLISTLKAYFQGRKELFEGLAIERLAGDAWEEWPVIHLDMALASSHGSLEEVKESMRSYMSTVANVWGLQIKDDDNAGGIFYRLIEFLHEKTGKQVVILIDEYDKPILDALHTPHLSDVVKLMQNFYQVVKSSVDKERFVFITGVSKFAHTSLFPGMNNPTDISQRSDFSTLSGYTEEEFRHDFSEYIDIAAKRLCMDREAFIEKMKDWYDGFRFTSDMAHVFNPVSVGKFFQNYKFKNYWYSTGTPTFLIKQMKRNPFKLDEYTKEWVAPMVIDKYDATSLNPLALALQTGYLTIADVREEDYGEFFRYDFPNEEIHMSWYDDMLEMVSPHYMELSAGRMKLFDGFKSGKIDQIMAVFQALFAGVSKENVGDIHEGYYRNMIYMLLTAFGIEVQAEAQVAGGRLDLVAQAFGQVYVFELKVSKTGERKDIEKLLREGFDQIMRNGYAEKYKFEADKVHVVSVVFEGRHHQLVAWKDE